MTLCFSNACKFFVMQIQNEPSKSVMQYRSVNEEVRSSIAPIHRGYLLESHKPNKPPQLSPLLFLPLPDDESGNDPPLSLLSLFPYPTEKKQAGHI